MLNERLTISLGATGENVVGSSHAVKVGSLIEVAGTTAVDTHGQVVGPGNAYGQTLFILAKIEQALRAAGATRQDVVRTRLFVTDMAHWQEIWRAHSDHFRNIKPVTTIVGVKSLIRPELLVEIEATAIL